MQLPKMHPQVIENAWGQGEEGIVKSVSGPRDVTHEAFGALRLVRKLGLSSICPNGVGFHFLTDGQDLVCRSFTGDGEEEIVVIDLITLSSSHFSLREVPMLNFDTIVSAFYHSGFMMVINWTQYPPEGYERLQCFEFDTGTLRKVPSPEIPGLEVYGTESVSAVCIYDKWICTAIGSYAEAKILVLDRKTKQLVATLLDPKLKSTKKQFKEYFCHSDIKMSGNAIAAVSERGQVAIWDTFTTNQAEPTRSWDAGFWADTVLFSESSQTTIISSKWHRRASAFKIGSGKVDQWERSSDNQRYRWISQDCGLKAEGYKVDNSGDYVPYIDISRIGEAKPFIGIKPVKRAMADIGEFYTAIIDWDCVTLVGSDGLIQLSFGEGNRPKREGCSGEIGTDVLINDFHPGREHMLFLQQKKRRPTKLARRDESSF